jgi:exopolysaccharide biosynthesis polyprenyl glycosylphosphotransferase
LTTETDPAAETPSVSRSAGRALNERRWWPLIVALLAGLDSALLALALFLAYWIRFGNGLLDEAFDLMRISDARPEFYLKLALLYVPASVLIFACMGAYSRRNVLQGSLLYQQIFLGVGLTALLAEFASYLSDRTYPIARGWLLLAWLLGALSVMVGRFASRRILRACHRAGILVQPAIIAGIGHEAQILEWHLDRARSEGVRVVGYVEATAPVGQAVPGGLSVLGHIDDLPDLIALHHIGQVFVATSDLSHADALRVLQRVLPTPAELSLAPDLFRMLTTGGHLRRLGGDTLVVVDKVRITGLDAVLKDILDVFGALILLVLSSPLWLVAAIAIKITSPGPLLARHPVLGVGGRRFDALKFRTIHYRPSDVPDDAIRDRMLRGLPVRQNPNVTALGRFLIRFSLDELPQLLNVLARQMSLVGPYKIDPQQVSLYGDRQLVLFTVRPGITGVCQVHGRGELTVEERSLLDAEYVRTYTIWRDLQILLASVSAVLRGTGAY